MIARPTPASAAATAITKKTKICPPMPSRCARATNVRMTGLSISSMHMKITIAFRRSSTPATPRVKSTAEMANAGLRSMLELSFREHDGAHDGREQQQARDLEGDQIRLEQWIRDGADHSLAYLHLGDGSGRQLDGVRRGSLSQDPQLEQQQPAQDGRNRETGRTFQIARTRTAEVEQ